MSVIRTQYGVTSASVTVPDSGARIGVFDLPRPSDVAETNTIDWTTRPYARKEFESGRCVITANSTLAVSGLTLLKIEILALNPGSGLTPLNLSFSQFPENDVLTKAAFPTPPVIRTVMDLSAAPGGPFTMDLQVTKDLLSSILVRTNESVRVTLYNPAGGAGDLTGVLFARYDMGLNAANFGSFPSLL